MKNGLEVFDFKEKDELPEIAAGNFLSKFKNPSVDNPAILKYQFLECAAQECGVPQKEAGCLPSVDVDNGETFVPMETVRDDLSSIAESGNSGSDAASQLAAFGHKQDPFSSQMDQNESKSLFTERKEISCHQMPSPEKALLNCALLDPPSNRESVTVKSDADECMNESSSSSPTRAETSVISNGHAANNCFINSEMGDVNISVDYVVYRGNHYTGCLVTFSCSSIKINGTPAYGDEGTFSIGKGVDDIICIESQHLQRFETVTIKLRILSNDAVQSDNVHGTSGVEELEFVVFEPDWFGKWEDITSLNVKYSALWSIAHDMDITMDGGIDVLQQRPYFPNFDVEFEEVIYPKGDSDAVSISKRDVDLLQPETFINDTLIDFYIKYLKNQIPPEEKHRFHFFNSFFFRKLADLDKDPSSASDGRAAFLRVHKWTRKVDIFGKDYIFIPVNFNLHWSLLVICHPGEVVGGKDEDPMKSPRVPCILHMDSIKGTHAGLKNLVQSYLWEEWKARQKDTSEDLSSKFLNLRFVLLELPQQENSFDCGLFLLHYLELFLIEAPSNFSPFRINKFTKFLNLDWFPPAEASLKRTLIQSLISELLQNHSRDVSSTDCSEPQSNFPESGIELVSDRCTPAGACHVNVSSSDAGRGIEITLLEASTMRGSQCVDDPGLVLREFFEPGAGPGSLLAQCSSFHQPSSYYQLNGAISQMEDDTETGEYVFFPPGETVFPQIAGMAPQAGSIPCSFRGFGGDDSWNPGISLQEGDNKSSSETSICASDDSDVGIIEKFPVEEDVSLCQKEKIDQERSLSTGDVVCYPESHVSAPIEEDASMCQNERSDKQMSFSMENTVCSEENPASTSTEMLENSGFEGIQYLEGIEGTGLENTNLASGQEYPIPTLQEDPNYMENGFHQDLEKTEVSGDMQTADDDMIIEAGEQRAAKRFRLTPSPEVEGGSLNGSLSKDLHL